MTHNEDRGTWLREGVLGMGTGIMYGITSVLTGHPIDTVKSKMQAQAGFESNNAYQTLAKTFRNQGIRGLYRGCIPPLWGSGIYRSTQFAVFEACYTYQQNFTTEIPFTKGLQCRVITSGIMAGSVRSIIECPLEFAKVRGQTQQAWQLSKIYTGFPIMWARTAGMMTTYFVTVDSIRRNYPSAFSVPVVGPFVTSGLSGTLGWILVWPLETVKTQIQGGYGGNETSLTKRLRTIVSEKGIVGLYRGIGPGVARAFLANGSAMVVMQFAQKKFSEWGLRK